MALLEGIYNHIDQMVDTAIDSHLPSGWKEGESAGQRLNPFDNSETIVNGRTLVNGVSLSQTVLDQLREAGINPLSCTRHELESAEKAIIDDGTVFEESHTSRTDFYDGLDPEETSAIATSHACGPWEARENERKQAGVDPSAFATHSFN